ncbi:MAG TPA: hypothetical protein VGX23_21605, partial [Actinocrinis sp.]|nr:hypothetical protein [Actinocrinis sp.]
MLATPNTATARTPFTKSRHAAPRRSRATTLTVALAAASLAIVPAGAALAATSVGAPAAAPVSHAVPVPARAPGAAVA